MACGTTGACHPLGGNIVSIETGVASLLTTSSIAQKPASGLSASAAWLRELERAGANQTRSTPIAGGNTPKQQSADTETASSHKAPLRSPETSGESKSTRQEPAAEHSRTLRPGNPSQAPQTRQGPQVTSSGTPTADVMHHQKVLAGPRPDPAPDRLAPAQTLSAQRKRMEERRVVIARGANGLAIGIRDAEAQASQDTALLTSIEQALGTSGATLASLVINGRVIKQQS